MAKQNEQDLMAKRVAEDEEQRKRKRRERVQYWEEYLGNLLIWIVTPVVFFIVFVGVVVYALYRLIDWLFF